MDNQHRNEWYGPEATMFKKCDEYNLINYQCEGTGTCLDYSLFPGIDLIFMDFNCSDTFREPMVNRDILDIRHYRQGRVEFEFQNQKVFHMRENEFCINTLTNMPASYSFPLGKCSGVSFVIDRDSLDSATIQQLSLYGIDIKILEGIWSWMLIGISARPRKIYSISLMSCMRQREKNLPRIFASKSWSCCTMLKSCGARTDMQRFTIPKNISKLSSRPESC